MAKHDDYEGKACGGAHELGINAARSVIVPRGVGFAVANNTGTMAAALAANSAVFAMRLDPSATRRGFVERMRIEFVTTVAFTVPVTAGRRLELFRGSGAAASGGTLLPPVPKHGIADTSEFSNANGGDIRLATTAALTTTGITFEANSFRTLSLVHVGAAGAYREAVWEFNSAETHPIQLDPGQVLALRNPAAFDAAGTWQMFVCVDWSEAPALDFTG